jgi:hypothetical protein
MMSTTNLLRTVATLNGHIHNSSKTSHRAFQLDEFLVHENHNTIVNLKVYQTSSNIYTQLSTKNYKNVCLQANHKLNNQNTKHSSHNSLRLLQTIAELNSSSPTLVVGCRKLCPTRLKTLPCRLITRLIQKHFSAWITADKY